MRAAERAFDIRRQSISDLRPRHRGGGEKAGRARPHARDQQQFLDAQSNRLAPMIPGDPNQAAIRMLGSLVYREALVLTFNDVMMLLGVLFALGVVLMPLVRTPRSPMA